MVNRVYLYTILCNVFQWSLYGNVSPSPSPNAWLSNWIFFEKKCPLDWRNAHGKIKPNGISPSPSPKKNSIRQSWIRRWRNVSVQSHCSRLFLQTRDCYFCNCIIKVCIFTCILFLHLQKFFTLSLTRWKNCKYFCFILLSLINLYKIKWNKKYSNNKK